MALDGIRPWTVTIRYGGGAAFTVRLYVTNNPNPIAGDTSEPQLGVDITAQTALAFDSGWKFVAVQLVSILPTNVSAYLLIG